MGNQNQKVLDPNNMNAPVQNQIDPKFEQFVKDEFHSKAINGKLYKDKFNEALACLEYFQIKRLRNTPLGERLFNIFDTGKQNCIDEQTWVKKLHELLYDKDMRVLYTFKAINKEDNNRISRKEFQDFYAESWKAAFRILGEKLSASQNNYGVTISKVNAWANLNLPQLIRSADQIFDNIALNNFIEFQKFKEWTISTDLHYIEAQVADLTQQVPISLYNLEAK